MTLLQDDDESDDYWDSVPSNEQIREDRAKNPPRRGRAKNYKGDGVVDTRMSQTECAFRTARHLVESPLLEGNVYVFVGGAEVNRRGDDVDEFPVNNYLSRWGLTKDPGRGGVTPAWIGFYTSRRSQRKLLVNFSKHDAHIAAYLATGQRLIVHCTAGNIGSTRSPAEHHDLNRTIGRAICWPDTKPTDMIAVCTPRSERFRTMTAKRSQSDGVLRAGLRFFHVDRGGQMIGLSES